jgi:hypothetical protein
MGDARLLSSVIALVLNRDHQFRDFVILECKEDAVLSWCGERDLVLVSSLGLPATVTRPLFVGCLNWR